MVRVRQHLRQPRRPARNWRPVDLVPGHDAGLAPPHRRRAPARGRADPAHGPARQNVARTKIRLMPPPFSRSGARQPRAQARPARTAAPPARSASRADPAPAAGRIRPGTGPLGQHQRPPAFSAATRSPIQYSPRRAGAGPLAKSAATDRHRILWVRSRARNRQHLLRDQKTSSSGRGIRAVRVPARAVCTSRLSIWTNRPEMASSTIRHWPW